MAFIPQQQDDSWVYDDNTPNSPFAQIGDDSSPDDPDGGSRPDPHHYYHRVSEKPGHSHPVAPLGGPRRSRLVIDDTVHRINGRQLSTPTRNRDRDMLDSKM